MAFVKIIVNQRIIDINSDFTAAKGLDPEHPNFKAIMNFNAGRKLYADKTGCFWFCKGFFEAYYDLQDRPWDSRTDVELLTWAEMVSEAKRSAFSLQWLPKLQHAFELAGVEINEEFDMSMCWQDKRDHLSVVIFAPLHVKTLLWRAGAVIAAASEGVIKIRAFNPYQGVHSASVSLV